MEALYHDPSYPSSNQQIITSKYFSEHGMSSELIRRDKTKLEKEENMVNVLILLCS